MDCYGICWSPEAKMLGFCQQKRLISNHMLEVQCVFWYIYIVIISYSIQTPKICAETQEGKWFLFRLGSKDMASMISNPRSGWPVLAVQMAQSRAIRCGSGDYQKWRKCECASYLRGMTSKDGRERSRVIIISGKNWFRLCRMVACLWLSSWRDHLDLRLINQHFHSISDIVGVKLLCAIVVPDEWSSFWYWKSFVGDSTGYYTKNNRSILPIRRTNISPHLRHFLKMIFVFARWDMWSFPEVVVRFGWLLTPKGDVQSSRPWHSGFGYPILQEQYVFV